MSYSLASWLLPEMPKSWHIAIPVLPRGNTKWIGGEECIWNVWSQEWVPLTEAKRIVRHELSLTAK